ncbi:MAG: hypothetical protein EXR62_00365 [Chloroflexi bacterium]|nr:hypothetical protein [Chloroflexota bacterium]
MSQKRIVYLGLGLAAFLVIGGWGLSGQTVPRLMAQEAYSSTWHQWANIPLLQTSTLTSTATRTATTTVTATLTPTGTATTTRTPTVTATQKPIQYKLFLPLVVKRAIIGIHAPLATHLP